MIGGKDIVIRTIRSPSESLDASVRIIREYWPLAAFENAPTGEKYYDYAAIPFGCISDLIVYRDADSCNRGECNSAMIQLIASANALTVVIDHEDAPNDSMLKSIQEFFALGPLLRN